MVIKSVPSKPSSTTTPNDADNIHSGVQLSREALYEQRVQEVYEDVQAGRCTFEEATDRVVEALVAKIGHRFTPRGREGLAAHVRAQCAKNPMLRKTLGG
jgi:hypothetical protein